METENFNFHGYVDEVLEKIGYRIVQITHEFMNRRLDELMKFVNSIRREYTASYGWNEETIDYFLNPLVDKWKFSFCIINGADEFCFVNFSSVYGDIIHNHCTYASKNFRGLNLAKLHMIKLCQQSIDSGFSMQEGYWPVNNNRSIILFLQMGWQIQSIRNNSALLMTADLKEVRNRTYNLLNIKK